MIHFLIYEYLKKKLAEAQNKRKTDDKTFLDFAGFMLCGACSKTCATIVAYPHGKFYKFGNLEKRLLMPLKKTKLSAFLNLCQEFWLLHNKGEKNRTERKIFAIWKGNHQFFDFDAFSVLFSYYRGREDSAKRRKLRLQILLANLVYRLQKRGSSRSVSWSRDAINPSNP